MTERTVIADERHLFTYGSLMFEPVWDWVVSRRYASLPVRLNGFTRHAVRDETYPAVVRSARATDSVAGRLYRNVSAADLARLDAFEGAQYERVGCEVEDPASGERLPAQVYLFLRHDLLLPQDWDAEAFGRDGIARFMKTYCPTT